MVQTLTSQDKFMPDIDFAWVELTNRCNLMCGHCYSDSGPETGYRDKMQKVDYIRVIEELREAGCTKIQFIGGEPTLNKDLPELISYSRYVGFQFIEVFTNLVSMSDRLLESLRANNVSIATSFYSANSETHDRITSRSGSFQKTIANMKRILNAGLQLRVGMIEMEDNKDEFESVYTFLSSIGVKNIGHDYVRGVGRADRAEAQNLATLCGSCAGGTLTIGPDGTVAPCNMSKKWAVGSVLTNSLEEVLKSGKLQLIRQQIKESVIDNDAIQMMCPPKSCVPYDSCCPTTQSCSPCGPYSCTPCRPAG